MDQFDLRDKLAWFEKGHVNGGELYLCVYVGFLCFQFNISELFIFDPIAETREVFGFLKEALPSEDGSKDIRWNFAKFLVDHKGQPIKRYSPKISPFEIKPDIMDYLQKMEKSSKTS